MIPNLASQWPGFPILGMVAWRAARRLLAMATGLATMALPAHAADPGRGAPLYQRYCAVCHGETGSPVWPGTPDFRRPQALMRPDAQVLRVIRQGRGVMPGYLGVLQERELLDLLAYLRTLS